MGKNIFEYRQARDKNLMETYLHNLRLAKYPISLIDVLTNTVNSTSTRFWVSPERACRIISQKLKTGELKISGKNKRKMMEDLFDLVMEMRGDQQYKHASISLLVSIAVEQPAPRFYLTPESAKSIICEIRKRRCSKLK